MGRKKKINQREAGKGKRFVPHDAEKKSYDQQEPVFSLTQIRKDFCISKCGKDEKAAFADTLHRLSQKTWAEIKSSHRHGIGFEKIDRRSIKSGIPEHLREDVNFIAFRFYGKAPMVGYRDKRIFHILWIDREFKLYKHG